MTTLLIANPAAGHGRGTRVVHPVAEAARSRWPDLRVALTTAPGEAISIASEATRARVTTILVLGGDGTVHEVANGVLQTESPSPPTIGVIPIGTGNDFARSAGTQGLRWPDVVEVLAAAQTIRLDVGRAWDEFFVNSLGVGLAADVAFRVNRMKHLAGVSAYLCGVVQTVWRCQPVDLTLSADDDTSLSEPCLALEIGNGFTSGGGFRLTPNARPDDGKLDFCFIRPRGRIRVLTKLPLALLGRHVDLPEVTMGRAATLEIRSRGQLRAHFDGECRAPGSSAMTVETVAGALPVLVTHRSILVRRR